MNVSYGGRSDLAELIPVFPLPGALQDFRKANDLTADGKGSENAPNEALLDAPAVMPASRPDEKQALLEAPDLKSRAEILVAVTEIELAKTSSGETPLQ